MRSGLVALLSGESTISTLVGARVYINAAKQGAAFPYIVLTQMGSDENQTLDGSTGVRSVEFDVDCKSKKSVQAETLGDAVRVFIENYTGAAGSQTINAVHLNSETSEIEPPTDGSDTPVHVVLLDITVQYSPV